MTSTGPKNITNKALKAALRKHAGVYVLAARDLGCDRTNVSQRVGRSPELQAYVQQIEDEIGDIAVGVIVDAIVSKKDVKTAKWYAGMKLKDRGFSTRTELSGLDGAPLASPSVHIEVRYVDAKPVEEDVL